MRAASRQPLLRAILVLFLGIVLLDVMGILVKSLLKDYAAQELSAWRNLIGMIPSLIVLAATGELRLSRKSLIIRQWPLALLRGAFVALAQLAFYLSLSHLEYATVSALTYTMSLFAVALSVPVLKERVGKWRWLAVLSGFAGAMMIVRPGSDAFSVFAIFPLIAAFLYASSSVAVRLIDDDVSNALVYLYSAFASAVGAVLVAALTSGFSPIASTTDMLKILIMGTFGGTGVLCLLVAVRLVPPSTLAPFNYFGILSAFTMGYLFFGEAPIDKLFPGVVLIVAGGLVIIWREHGRAKGASFRSLK